MKKLKFDVFINSITESLNFFILLGEILANTKHQN